MPVVYNLEIMLIEILTKTKLYLKKFDFFKYMF